MSFAWQIIDWQDSGWQDFAVTVICLAAAIYVVRVAWRTVAGRKTVGCGTGCGTGCGKRATDEPKRVLSIETPPADSRK